MSCWQRKERSKLTEYFLGSILTPVMAPPKGRSGKEWVKQTDVLCWLACSPAGGGDNGNHDLVGESQGSPPCCTQLLLTPRSPHGAELKAGQDTDPEPATAGSSQS